LVGAHALKLTHVGDVPPVDTYPVPHAHVNALPPVLVQVAELSPFERHGFAPDAMHALLTVQTRPSPL
jgi:hypothetical protein